MISRRGSDRARRIAIRLLRWYPRPWRARYQREMQALLEEMPVRGRQVLNIAGAAAREWLSPRALGWPARSAAGRLQFARAVTFFVGACGLNGVARIVATRLVAEGVQISDWTMTAAAILFFAFIGRTFVALGARMKAGWGTKRRARFQFSSREIVLCSLLMLPFVILLHAEAAPTYYENPMMATLRPWMPLLQVFLWTNLAFQSSTQTQRLQRIQSVYLTRRRFTPPPSLPLGL